MGYVRDRWTDLPSTGGRRVHNDRWLIPLDDLIAASRWCESPGALADDLDVTEDVLTCRLDHLTPAERAAIEAALDHTN